MERASNGRRLWILWKERGRQDCHIETWHEDGKNPHLLYFCIKLFHVIIEAKHDCMLREDGGHASSTEPWWREESLDKSEIDKYIYIYIHHIHIIYNVIKIIYTYLILYTQVISYDTSKKLVLFFCMFIWVGRYPPLSEWQSYLPECRRGQTSAW